MPPATVSKIPKLPKNFNPVNQTIVLFEKDGTPYTYPLAVIDKSLRNIYEYNISYTVQIGAAGVLLVVLLLLTPAEKKKSALFVVNCLSLVFLMFRAILETIYPLTDLGKIYWLMSGNFHELPLSTRIVPMLSSASPLILYTSIQVSLILQVRSVFSSDHKHRNIATWACSLLALASFATWFVQTVLMLRFIAYPLYWEPPNPKIIIAARSLFAFSICVASLIFTAKLGLAIRERKILKLQKFGPIQVIFIMGINTLFIPAIFSILDVASNQKWHGIASSTAGITALLLPLSSLWAQASVTGNAPPSLRNEFMRSGSTGDSSEKPSQGSIWSKDYTTKSMVYNPYNMPRSAFSGLPGLPARPAAKTYNDLEFPRYNSPEDIRREDWA